MVSSSEQYPNTAIAGRIPAVTVHGVRKTFGSGEAAVHAVDGVDLEIVDGEFFCLLGPSGSGKTTLLRMIAGFELPTEGSILLDGQDVTNLPPFDRDVNTVFQDYALFPHMTVQKNIEYGLKVKGVGSTERRERAADALSSVALDGYGDRKPSQLSGGQRQRVALARALVNRPKVLLLDEPLGALDLKLRQQMQVELKNIQHRAGITFVFVTHDQEEALAMSDRIAVFNKGRIEQVGTPEDLYERPVTPFVAGFVGTSNSIVGAAATALLGLDGAFALRPEKIRILTGPASPGEVVATGTVAHTEYLGPVSRHSVSLDVGADVFVLEQNSGPRPFARAGERVSVAFASDAAVSVG